MGVRDLGLDRGLMDKLSSDTRRGVDVRDECSASVNRSVRVTG